MSAVGWDVDEIVESWDGRPPLAGDRTADACVVGLGASGLAAVEALAERGVDVVGVDAGRVAARAAGRNGGFLLAGPSLWLHQAIERWGPAAVDLYNDTLAEIDRLEAVLGCDLVRRTGSIRLAGLPGAPDQDELADCRSQAAALRAHGIEVTDYEGELGLGIHVAGDAAVNPAARAIALAQRLPSTVTLHEGTAVRSVAAGRVDTEHGSVTAPVVVVAVDGALEAVVPQLAGRVRSTRLQMLATAAVAPRLPCPVYARHGYDYAQQLPDGRLFLGGGRDRFVDDEWGRSAEPTTAVQRYLDSIAASFAGRPVEVTHRWAAPVGYTDDARPLCVAVDESADGVVLAVGGYCGHGNLVGPVLARAAVARALDGTPPPAWCAT